MNDVPGIVAGREYVVLAITATPKASMPLLFMLHLPDDRVTDWAWYEVHAFEVLDDALPSNWVYSTDEHGFSLIPANWTRPWHWDDLLNEADAASRRRAWDDYHRERDLILSEAGRPPGDQKSISICRAPPFRRHS